MEVFRLVRSKYKDDFSGKGAYLYGGRWNSPGVYALYAASHISLSVLEIVVNLDREILHYMPSYHLLVMEVPDTLVYPFKHTALEEGWKEDMDLTRFIGDGFLHTQSNLGMEIPSAVIPEESNYLINPLHEEFSKVRMVRSVVFGFDERLLG
ncbi:RES family NAD+ phosphorylase [Membranihabitans maritimus]|uniref:RES family NAD+ phosphorylase n=1 Tax=Membranihabitans maritimus TaxID=2904244 RepID=UPI001F3485B7|nr:RES family NAD+ phosphorylase [Membranihabitans maritimus]